MKKYTILLTILVVLVVGLSGCVDNKANNTTQKNNSQNQTLTNNSNNSSNQTNITAAQAQEIAKKFIEQPGAVAGTAYLMTIDGNKVYIVPIMINGTKVGQIEIDAQTGANVGGAGGTP